MFLSSSIHAQNSFEITGASANYSNSQFRMNGLESSVSNSSLVRDWSFSAVYSTEFSDINSGNLYLLSLTKRLGQHYFDLRYTPGYQKEFLMQSGYSIISYDSVPLNLRSTIRYQEKFGFGYSFRISSKLTAGASLRYFNEEFTDDQVIPVYTDSLTTITTTTDKRTYSRWRGDFGMSYSPEPGLTFSLSTINLVTDNVSADKGDLLLKTDKLLLTGIDYQVTNLLKTKLSYETNNSFSLGLNLGFGVFDGNLSFSADIFHDKYQQPFIAGFIPAVNYTSEYFSVTLSGVKYLTSRSGKFSLSDFRSSGVHNIINNNFSTDRAALTFNFALNAVKEQKVKFQDINIIQNIFPSLTENYIDSPFAEGKVINLTSKPVTVMPYSRIPGLNNESVQSPAVTVAPFDTARVSFFTLFDGTNRKQMKTEISQASFYISLNIDDVQDEIQKPVLIHEVNSWDGNTSNLRYFIKKDFDFANQQALKYLNVHKTLLDTIPGELSTFYKIRLLYSDFISNMIYVADPRSSSDRVQFPAETFTLKGGDCDDLSVAFSSLLESVGIQTAFIDYKSDSTINHVGLLVNTELSPDLASYITVNDKKYYVRQNSLGKDEIWIPVETTNLKSFNDAWETGSDLFYEEAINNYGLVKGSVNIVDVY